MNPKPIVEPDPITYIVILNWKRPSDTLSCIRAAQQTRRPRSHIVVVDNASSDGSTRIIRHAFPNLPLITNEKNLGYSGGNNVGIRYALSHGADHVLILNNDALLEPDTLGYLVRTMEPDVAAVGGKVYLHKDHQRLWAAGECFARRSYPYDHGQFDQPRPVAYAVGCCILLNAVSLQEIGLFDEAFFLVHEEKEWCWRARQAGYQVIYQPQAVTYHSNDRSFTNTWSPIYHYLSARNELLFWEKQGIIPGGWRSLYGAFLVGREEIRLTLKGKDKLSRSWGVIRGLIDYFQRRFGPPPPNLGGYRD
jgi:GT2 family glycosyltransferase